MSGTDPSLDARIWAYVRSEGSHTERKKLEAEVGENPAAARRYSTIKLMHQRQTAHAEQGDEALVQKKSKPKSADRVKQADKTKLEKVRPGRDDKRASYSGAVVLALGFLLLATSAAFYFAALKSSAADVVFVRDYLHAGTVLLGSAMFFFAQRGKLWMLALATFCIAASCGFAAMLVR